MRPDHLETDAVNLLQRLAPRDEGREEQVAQGAVLEQERPQRVAVDGDVVQRLGDDRRQEDGLPREEVQLTEEARAAVADDLVAGRVENRHLSFDDRDERIAPVADAEEHVTDSSSALLAQLGELLQLRGGEHRTGRRRHGPSVPVRARC